MSKKAMFASPDGDFKMVAAIEVGTSYSGYAYCSRRNGKSIANHVILNPVWMNSDKTKATMRAPTCLLLNDIREFEAFGYEAEKQYLALLKEGRQNRCYYFRRFRPKLYGREDLKATSMLKDEGGKVLPALKVFSIIIRFLKSHMLHDMCIRGLDVEPDEVRWVVTVPAVWSDLAKQFVRKAAEQAGIPGESLVLALEAEAASLFSQNVTSNKSSGNSRQSITVAGTKYMVATVGGGMTDIIVHEKKKDGLREVCRGSGGKIGGIAVNNVFIQFLSKLLGEDIIEEFFDKNRKDGMILLEEFEFAKRRVTPLSSSSIELKIPLSLDTLCKKKRFLDDLNICISKSIYKDRVTIKHLKLKIDAAVSNELFRATTMEIVKLIKLMLQSKPAGDVNILVLTGGLAESPVVNEILNKELVVAKTTIKEIIVPPEPEVAVLKGAVIFGHNPSSIVSRVNRYTLGMRIARLYNPEIHQEKRRQLIHGIEYILDIFSPFLTVGTRVPIGFVSHQALTSTEPYQKSIPIDVFCTPHVGQNFVNDDGCSLLGTVDYPIPRPSEKCRTIYVDFILGNTELELHVTDKLSGQKTKFHFPLIQELKKKS